jgi:hypothetical protein
MSLRSGQPLRCYRVVLFVCLVLLPGGAANAEPVLIGSRTLETANDLTVIQTSTNTLEWLDLTSTVGMSIQAAATTYGADGFHWATGAEVSELWATTGIIYASAPNTFLQVTFTGYAGQIALMDLLGVTDNDGNPLFGSNGARGWIDDHTTTTAFTAACISNGLGVCSPPWGSVVNSTVSPLILTSDGTPAVGTMGTYLVRTVPEPSSLAQVALGLCAVAVAFITRRRGRHSVVGAAQT